MDASIIILTKNAGQNFPALLQRLFSQKYLGSYEVLIIDSGSTDDTVSIARSFPAKINEIRPSEFHHGKTRNLGAELAAGKFLAYISQDALPLDDYWLQNITNDLKNAGIAMTVGKQIAWQTINPPEKFFYSYFFPDFRIVVTRNDSNYYRDNMFISNVNSAVRKDIWQQFRFSETVLMGEDKELAKRLLGAGLAISYQPEAAVYHAHNHTIASIFRRGIQGGIALRQGVAGLPQSRGTFAKKALDYWSEEFKFLKVNRYLHWLPYCILYDKARYVGSFCGRKGWLSP